MRLFILGYILTIGMVSTNLFQKKSKEESRAAGKEIYQDFCVQCHMTSGMGVSGVFPPLKDSDYGLKGEIQVNDETYDGVMVSQGLEDDEIADVMNYILNEWGNSYEEQVTPTQVSNIQKTVLD
jgi:mono/diheme cytochrome c family protein